MKKLISIMLAIMLVSTLVLGGCKGKSKTPPPEPNKAATTKK
ncbi:MAG: hypothetical protein NTX52_09255 [Planctomycetota bacterium]|nr:hypothetical protein [Planctomycetota bacterium]